MNNNLLKRAVTNILKVIIIAAQAGVFAYFWFTFYRKLIFLPFWNRGNWALVALYGLIVLLFSKLFGGFRVGYLKNQDILYSMSLAAICTNLVSYLQMSLIHRNFMPFRPIVYMILIDIFLVFLWTFTSSYIYKRLYPAMKMLIIYEGRNPGDFIDKLNKRKDKYDVSEMIDIAQGEEIVYKKMEGYKGVILWDLTDEIRNTLIKHCLDKSIGCYVTPKISDIIILGSERIHLFDTPLLYCKNVGPQIEPAIIKRLMDIILSLAGLVIASPIMAISAIFIKLYDRGPVFYKQNRLTLNGREFQIYKFRSMKVDSEKDGARLATKGDDRITPVGRILRNLHFDELPQLINILKGDMSLVGPRPERKEIMERYCQDIPEFSYRLKMKAGLTGYAQVYGKYNTTPYDKLKLDLFYIENYSLLLDLKIILLTCRIFFLKEVSEGVDETQRDARKENSDKKDNKKLVKT